MVNRNPIVIYDTNGDRIIDIKVSTHPNVMRKEYGGEWVDRRGHPAFIVESPFELSNSLFRIYLREGFTVVWVQ